jgi:hypothetical protein
LRVISVKNKKKITMGLLLLEGLFIVTIVNCSFVQAPIGPPIPGEDYPWPGRGNGPGVDDDSAAYTWENENPIISLTPNYKPIAGPEDPGNGNGPGNTPDITSINKQPTTTIEFDIDAVSPEGSPGSSPWPGRGNGPGVK